MSHWFRPKSAISSCSKARVCHTQICACLQSQLPDVQAIQADVKTLGLDAVPETTEDDDAVTDLGSTTIVDNTTLGQARIMTGDIGVERWQKRATRNTKIAKNEFRGRRELWWLDSRQDSEHNVSRSVKRDETGCFHQRQASRQLPEFAQQARRRRRNGVVDLANRREDGYLCGQLGVDS
jgi:hypothetical protein